MGSKYNYLIPPEGPTGFSDIADENLQKLKFDKFKKSVKKRRTKERDAIQVLSILYDATECGFLSFSTDEPNKFLKPELDYMKEIFGFDMNESIIIARTFCTEETSQNTRSLYMRMDISYLEFKRFDYAVDYLTKQEYIYLSADDSVITRNNEAYDSVVKGEKFIHIDRSDVSIEEIITDANYMLSMGNVDTFDSTWERWTLKYKGHPLLDKLCSLFSNSDIHKESPKVMMLFVLSSANNINNCIDINTLNSVYSSFSARKSVMSKLRDTCENNSTIFKDAKYNSFIAFNYDEGMANTSEFVLSDEGMKYFGIADIHNGNIHENYHNIKKNESIVEKDLFYDGETKTQIDRLCSLLDNDNFNDIQKRLKESKMRIGFNILLYGYAGTGKTETCLQLSRITKRDLYIVEVSDFKDKFVGESEKRIKSIFSQYRSLVDEYNAKQKPVPIMLLNEADAIIGIRKKGAENAVDKMENSVQNIILNEMENINGIMIATTNLTENFDSAFERRFIYKVKYEKPTKDTKMKIWKSNIPSIDDDSIEKLSDEFDFSGGEIENIARKSTIEHILSGCELSYDMIRELSKNEKIVVSHHSKVGFI